MSAQGVRIGLGLLAAWLVTTPAWAGYYTTIDAPEEVQRFSPDYERVFRFVLGPLKTIPLPEQEYNPPIRQRYVLIEALGGKGGKNVQTVEQKLNYSAVLIRRGKADEAVLVLAPLVEEPEQRGNFVILSQYASARFLAAAEFRPKAAYYMKKALDRWPQRWADVKEAQKKFLTSIGWEGESAFDRYRGREVCFARMLKNRLEEEERRAKKLPVEETVDPIFVDNPSAPVFSKEPGKPLRFVSEGGKFEPGRIAAADWSKLPDDAVEIVEQLLIWVPNDDRLLWLLAEVMNARAMKQNDENAKNQAIKNAYVIYKQLMDDAFKGKAIYGRKEIKERYDILGPIVQQMPPPNILGPEKLPDEKPGMLLDSREWWREIIVSFVTGFAVGLAALWQIQEMRRRRQARLAGSR